MSKYKPLLLNSHEREMVDTLTVHAKDMFPTAEPAGHDWQHIESQMKLWAHVGGSVLEEPQFAGVDRMVPFLVSLGHDLNRLPPFMSKSKAQPDYKEYNARAEQRMLGMYAGFLHTLNIPTIFIRRAMEVLEGKDPTNPEYIICDDLDKIPGPLYAWRCAAVGAGQRVKHDVVKRYLVAKTGGESARLVADEKLETWLDDLEWAEDWDPCVAKKQDYVIRSAVLHEIADPGFEFLRRIRSETETQLRTMGYEL